MDLSNITYCKKWDALQQKYLEENSDPRRDTVEMYASAIIPGSTAILVKYWTNIQPIWNSAHILANI